MSTASEKNDLNYDPIHHYLEGRGLEKAGEFRRALVCYQKALACTPQILGARPWFHRYLLGNRAPAGVNCQQIADIYAALGRGYASCGMPGNALLAFDSASAWHPSATKAHRLKAATRVHMAGTTTSTSPAAVADRPVPPGMDEIAGQLTLVITTHLTKKLVKYRELSPPSSHLVSMTFHSMLEAFGAPVALLPKVLCYDLPQGQDSRSHAYEKALDLFCRRNGFDMRVYPHAGLHAILRDVMPKIATPFVFLVEHDWFFESVGPELADLLALFLRHENLHHVRFNKRDNRIAKWDYLMEVDDRIAGCHLLKTSAYSNNPCILRVATFLERWLPLVALDPEFSKRGQNGSALGLEEPLFRCYMHDIRRFGFVDAHRRWGTYIIGAIGDCRRIVHLGE